MKNAWEMTKAEREALWAMNDARYAFTDDDPWEDARDMIEERRALDGPTLFDHVPRILPRIVVRERVPCIVHCPQRLALSLCHLPCVLHCVLLSAVYAPLAM
jgi:hypothetical protein